MIRRPQRTTRTDTLIPYTTRVRSTELIRRMGVGEAFAMTTRLITKADGTKFGKTEGGNVWLDPALTSPYKFYQFWLNVSDEDVKKYVRIFTLATRVEIETLEAEHDKTPHQRLLQKIGRAHV